MSTSSTNKVPSTRRAANTADVSKAPIYQAFMAGGSKGWPENITTSARRKSSDSSSPILSQGEYPRMMSVGSSIEGRRPRRHSRKTSRTGQQAKAKSSPKSSRKPTGPINENGTITAPNPKRFRFSAIVPFLLSSAAFSFSLVLILAGRSPGHLSDVHLVSFNTTNLGTGIIEFAPASSTPSTTSTSVGLGRRQTLPPMTPTTFMVTMTPGPVRRDFNPLDPLGLIPIATSYIASRVSVDSSVLASGGSAIASALTSIPFPGLPISGNGSTTTTGLLGALGGIIDGGLGSFLSALLKSFGITGLTQAIDDELNALVTGLLSKVVSDAGVESFYSLYILTVCKGSSAANLSSCSTFSSTANTISNISAKVPTSLVVIETNISSPALHEVTSAVASLGPRIDSLEKFFLALMIISLLNSASAILLAIFGIFLPQNRLIIYSNLSLATIGALSRSIDAVLATIIAATVTWATNKFGNSVGVSASLGGTFIALIWLGFILQLLATSYWVCVWFVEIRQISFRLRKREVAEIGDYKGIWKEIKSDVRSAKNGKEQEKNFAAV